MSTVLVVEDDVQLRRFLRTTLASHGHTVVEAGTLREATGAIGEANPALVLLDLGLPDGDGMALLRAPHPPTIVLSANGKEGDKVIALDAGAEDYLTKPFGVSELLARIRVVLRRATAPEIPDLIEVGPIVIDQPRHVVTVDGVEVHLTPIEFRLLLELAREPGRVITHKHLLSAVWGPNAVEQTQYLRVHMAALRRKIEDDPARPRWLLTEAGVGYRLREPAAQSTASKR